jgi:hypothetical protein
MDRIMYKVRSYCDKHFILLTSAIITFLLFNVYIGETIRSISSDGGQVGYSLFGYGDLYQLCFPQFIKLGSLLKDTYSFFGIDFGTHNGASEFFLRPNLTTSYLPLVFFTLVSQIFNENKIDVLLLIFMLLQSFFCFYYAQKLVIEYFQLNRYMAIFFAVCAFVPLITGESFYLGFFINATIAMPLAYYSLKTIYDWKKYWIILSLLYVFSFTAGYIVIDAFHVFFNILFVSVFYLVKEKGNSVKDFFKRIFLAPLVSGSVCLCHYASVLYYNKKIVQATPNLFQATQEYKMDFVDILGTLTTAYRYISPIEGAGFRTSIGIICSVLFIIILNYCLSKMKKSKKVFLWFGIISFFICILWSMGHATPIPELFYYYLPIFGSMHIPLRFLIIIKPFIFLSLLIGINEIEDDPRLKKMYKLIGYIFLAATVLFGVIYKIGVDLKVVFSNLLMYELIFAALFFLIASSKGIKKQVLLIPSVFILFQCIVTLFNTSPVPNFDFQAAEKSIVYNDTVRNTLDDYVGKLPKSDVYRYISMTDAKRTSVFMPDNYEWYGKSQFNLVNYSGYEPHISRPAEYSKKFYWFDIADWKYIANTRGRFAVLQDEAYKTNEEILKNIIEPQKTIELSPGWKIYTLKRFIPEHYTGQAFSVDNIDRLDNGYFYSPDLDNGALLSFNTDNSTFVSAEFLSAERDARITYLYYPVKRLKVYIDGVRSFPEISNMQMFFTIPSGKHKIEIKYENKLEVMSMIVFGMYYVLVFICGILALRKFKFRKQSA